MIYILIIITWASSGVATTTQEFNSLNACKSAGALILNASHNEVYTANTMCAKK